MAVHVSVDTSLCNGYGNCVVAAPAVFDLDESTNLAVVLHENPDGDDQDAALEAAADCPARAIKALHQNF
jgi:ferredoxin